MWEYVRLISKYYSVQKWHSDVALMTGQTRYFVIWVYILKSVHYVCDVNEICIERSHWYSTNLHTNLHTENVQAWLDEGTQLNETAWLAWQPQQIAYDTKRYAENIRTCSPPPPPKKKDDV